VAGSQAIFWIKLCRFGTIFFRPAIKVQAGTSNASAFPRQPSASLCFCATKNPTSSY